MSMRSIRPHLLVALLLVGVLVGAVVSIDTGGREHRSSGQTRAASDQCVDIPAPPNLVGTSLRQAREKARHAGFDLSPVIRVPSAQASGIVINQEAVQGCEPPSHPPVMVEVSSGPLKDRRLVLAYARVPPATYECTATVAFDIDGNIQPLTCGPRSVNVAAWIIMAKWYGADGFARFVHLGPDATPGQVAKAFRAGIPTGQTGLSEFEIARAYYGWPRWVGFPLCLINGHCPSRG